MAYRNAPLSELGRLRLARAIPGCARRARAGPLRWHGAQAVFKHLGVPITDRRFRSVWV
jgi:hypothetical protein